MKKSCRHRTFFRRTAASLAALVMLCNVLLGALWLQVAKAGQAGGEMQLAIQVICTPTGFKLLDTGSDGSLPQPDRESCPACLLHGQAVIAPPDTAHAPLPPLSALPEGRSDGGYIPVRRIHRSCLRNRAPPLST